MRAAVESIEEAVLREAAFRAVRASGQGNEHKGTLSTHSAKHKACLFFILATDTSWQV